jgi:beta-N-acetylhexosaminidase
LIGIDGTALDAAGRELLRRPQVGGVVLFSRNYANPQQLAHLVADIRALRTPRLLVCVDQEGGRVQRLRQGFTLLPPLGALGRLWDSDPARAIEFAYRHARVMAAEMLSVGIDLSFAPVLDLDRGSRVIGDRAFASGPGTVVELGRAYLAGMHAAGMKATGKHFPGHGSVRPDSHTEDVVDGRDLADLEAADLVPFTRLAGELDAMMVAHVTYPSVDDRPAGYSRRWLRDYLRGRLGYRGVILSDDLGMHAAHVGGNLAARTHACLAAGCDLVLVCRSEDVEELLGRRNPPGGDATPALASLYGVPLMSAAELAEAASRGAGEWQHWQASLEQLNDFAKTTGA